MTNIISSDNAALLSSSHRPVMVVGEAWGEAEEATGEPFAGPAGHVIHGLLRQAGIEKSACYFTNVFSLRPRSNRLDSLLTGKADAIPGYRPIASGKYVHRMYAPELQRLQAEIEAVRPNVIIALGNYALWALCKKSGIKKYRGSPLATFDGRFKVLPTWSPASVLKQWEIRVIMLADISKAAREMSFPEIRRPQRFIYMEPTLEEIGDFYNQFLRDQPFISCDTETRDQTITEVGFGTADGRHCLVIPFWDRTRPDGNYWRTLDQEREAWRWVRHICANHHLVGQNFAYDMQYFWRTVRIPCPKFLGDTMLQHHSLQPELEKGLGFLGSIYTNEPSWKFMRTDHSTLKLGDE